MSKTPSTMIALNTSAPDFYLMDAISNQKIKLSDYQKGAKGTLIMFICNHCPFVKHLMDGMIDLANDYEGKSLKIIAINSNNNPDYPEDSFENMQLTAAKEKLFSLTFLMKLKKLLAPIKQPVHRIFSYLMHLINWFIAANLMIHDQVTKWL